MKRREFCRIVFGASALVGSGCLAVSRRRTGRRQAAVASYPGRLQRLPHRLGRAPWAG